MTPEEIHQPESFAWLAKRSNVVRLALIFFLILSAASFFLIYGHYRDVREKAFREDRKSVQLISLIVEAYLNDMRSTLESYASRPLLMEAVRNKDASAAKQHLLSLKRISPGMDNLLIADRKGTIWVIMPDRPDVLGKNFAWRDWYRGVTRKKMPYVGEAVLRVTGEKDTAIHIAVPILDKKGGVIGILLNTQRAVEIGRILRQAPLEEGLSISVTDRNGTLIFSSRYAHTKALARYPFFDTIKKTKTGAGSTVAVPDPADPGKARHISYTILPGAGLHVFVGRDQRTIWSPVWPHMVQMITISTLLFLCVITLVLYIRNRTLAQSALERLQKEKEISANRSRFSELFNQFKSGVAIYQAVDGGRDFEILELNAAARRITKVEQNVKGKSVLEVYPGLANHTLLTIFQNVWRTGEAEEHPTFLYQDNRQAFWADNYVFKLPSGELVSVFDDVTARKLAADKISRQTHLLSAINRLFAETLKSQDREAVARTCLAVAQSITDSELGFIGEVSPDGRFNTTAVSDKGWSACAMPQKEATAVLQNMIIRGLWGQVILRKQSIIINEPGAFPDRVGVPEGHPPLTSFLGVPLKDEGKTIGMIALANRTDGFTGEQREDLEEMAVSLVEALRRNKAEEEVTKMNLELEKRVHERTEDLAAKTAELERINRVFVDRELKMRELKARIAEMEKHSSQQ
jgi:hypothetical protein